MPVSTFDLTDNDTQMKSYQISKNDNTPFGDGAVKWALLHVALKMCTLFKPGILLWGIESKEIVLYRKSSVQKEAPQPFFIKGRRRKQPGFPPGVGEVDSSALLSEMWSLKMIFYKDFAILWDLFTM